MICKGTKNYLHTKIDWNAPGGWGLPTAAPRLYYPFHYGPDCGRMGISGPYV